MLQIVAKNGVAKAGNLAAAMPEMTMTQRTYQSKPLVERGMLQPIKEDARQYAIGFCNNYLIRDIIWAVSEEGFIPASLNRTNNRRNP